MTEVEKMFVVKAATNKIGATRAHNLLSSMKGGYAYVHGTTDDFKNHQWDVNVFIGESDAQMLINKMENRKMYVPNFTFQYRVENIELVSMFWADEVAKCNYKEFGDIVSFDATFNSNKYNMSFVPFIGIDNHEKCVTLGSEMLLHEDTKSYTWLLTAFMTAFLKEPTMIVTDQDGAMKRSIEAVFTKSKHRLCMLHIMKKKSSKIPAYFIDSSLYGLMRTTSRSESENSFFKSFTSPGATLVSFMMSYESAMERKRYRQETLDFKTIDAAPKYLIFVIPFISLHQLVSEPKFLTKMFPRRSEGEELEYPFFEGDGSSSDEWRDYGMAGDDYEGPPIFDDDQYEEESMPVYDTDIEDVIEEEEGFIEKGGFGGKEDNIEDVVVVANDLCSSMIQTTLNVDFEEDINTKSHELVSFGKSIIIKVSRSLFKFLIRKKYQDWYLKAAPMVDKFSFKTIKVRGRVIIKKENLMQGIQI
ncbi:regulation of nuclear pre-mRNA domain-containing protein 1B [Tanacetum coccineum]